MNIIIWKIIFNSRRFSRSFSFQEVFHFFPLCFICLIDKLEIPHEVSEVYLQSHRISNIIVVIDQHYLPTDTKEY